MAGTIKRLYGPAFLSNSVANIYNQSDALLYTVIKKMHFYNLTNTAASMRIYIGATGASAGGTELYFDFQIAPYSEHNVYGALRLNSTDFLTGVANLASTITVTLEGELVPV